MSELFVADGLFDPDLIEQATKSWPGLGWPGWFAYPASQGAKYASNLDTPLPPAVVLILYRMAMLPVDVWLGIPGMLPDLGLWGAGMHDLPPGPGLPRHLDAACHGRLGLTRLATMALYLSPWQDVYGGELEVMTSGGISVVKPVLGRVVCFTNTPEALHRVLPVTGPSSRRSLALFWYGPPGDPCLRTKADWK